MSRILEKNNSKPMKDWTKKMSAEEIKNTEDIIAKMKCDPKPTVNEFLSVIERAIEDSYITTDELLKELEEKQII